MSSSAASASNPAPVRGRKVFKKASPNQKLKVYIDRRDFYNRDGVVDVIDGMVTIEDGYLDGRKVFARVQGSLTCDHAEMDVLGVDPHTLVVDQCVQVYPPSDGVQTELTSLQRKLRRKLGEASYPFGVRVPAGAPQAVALHNVRNATVLDGKPPVSLTYTLTVYVGHEPSDHPRKRNSVKLDIRVMNAMTAVRSDPPRFEEVKSFGFGKHHPISVTAELDRAEYTIGETITLSCTISNASKKTLKGVSARVRQLTKLNRDVGNDQIIKNTVAKEETDSGFCVKPGDHERLNMVLCPTLATVTEASQLAMAAALKDAKPVLAASSEVSLSTSGHEMPGIFVEYEVKVKLDLGMASHMEFKLPFSLYHRAVGVRETGGVASGKPAKEARYVDVPPTVADMANEEEQEPLEFVFEEFLHSRAEKFFAQDDVGTDDDESAAPTDE